MLHRGFKLVHDRHSGESRLFDLSRDPGETRDVKADHPDVYRRLMERLALRDRSAVEAAPLPSLPEDEVERLRALGYL